MSGKMQFQAQVDSEPENFSKTSLRSIIPLGTSRGKQASLVK
jgi:hypothetical protein